MRKSNREVNGEKVFRYSIRKYHFGAASVAVAALMFFANGAVKADPLPVSPVTANTEKVNAGVTNLTEGVPLEKSLESEGNKEIVAPEPAEKTSNKEDGAGSNAQGEKEIKVSDKAVLTTNQTEEINKAETNGKEKEVVTNKDKLESLLKEIDQLNLKDYTEDSVKVLQEKVAKAKEVLVNAKTQKEIDLAYNALVGYKNAGLKRVPKPKGELTPKPDTTNGKETVGIKAENTEPNGTNIAGHNHSLNGTTRSEGSGLRAAPKPELADVQIGRWNGTRRTFDSSNVFVTPANQGIVGNVMKIKAISASDNFTNIEVTGNQGFPLKVKKNIKGKEAELYFEGNTPSNGSWNMTVTATTAKGTKSFNFGYYTALRKPTILTQNTALEGKAKEKPTIEVEVPTFSPAPTGAKFKVYLVRGGRTDGWDNNGNAYPSGYSVLASADVVASTGGKGTATINASNYRVSELGTTAFKAITVIEVNGRENDTDPGERGSWFSDERRATEKLANKTALTTALSGETTTKASSAYYNATPEKQRVYDQAIASGKQIKDKANATQTEVDNATSAINNAKQNLGGQDTNKTALTTALSDDATTKASSAYYNATPEKQRVYDQAIASGKQIKDKANATQTEVDNATSAITDAKAALGGVATNKDALRTATSTEDAATKATAAYYNAEASKKATYDQAVTAGKAVLARDNATQTEVNDAVSAINTAKNALNGNYVSSTSSTVQPSHPVQNDSSAQASPSVPTSQPTQPDGEGQPSTPVQASSTDNTVTPDEDSIRDKEPSTLSADQSRTDRSMEDVDKEESPVSAKQQLDKSELRTLSYELEERLKALTKVSDAKIDAAKTVLLDAKKAISDSDLTEQGLRDAVEAVKKALASLKDVKVNDVDSKTAQDKSDVKKVAEDSKDSDKMSETYSVPTGVFVAGLLALLGVIIFWLIRRKKDSELKQLSIELTKVLEQQDVAKADKKVLAKAQKLLQETLDFVKEESGSAETEAKLVEQLKAIISKLK